MLKLLKKLEITLFLVLVSTLCDKSAQKGTFLARDVKVEAIGIGRDETSFKKPAKFKCDAL